MMRNILFVAAFMTAFVANGQLARKVRFGAQFEYATERGISGCKVLQVVTATSTALKLQENDLILSIDNRPV